MIYPNLSWAMSHKRIILADFEKVLRMSNGQISRKLCGQRELLPHEKEIIAQTLGYDSVWLFAPARPVPLKRSVEAQAASYQIEPKSAEIVPDDYGAADVESELGLGDAEAAARAGEKVREALKDSPAVKKLDAELKELGITK